MTGIDISQVKHHTFDAGLYPHGAWTCTQPQSEQTLAEERALLASGQAVIRSNPVASPQPNPAAVPAKGVLFIVGAVLVVGAVLLMPQPTKFQESMDFFGALAIATLFVDRAVAAFRGR
jgi:hypothetical protein